MNNFWFQVSGSSREKRISVPMWFVNGQYDPGLAKGGKPGWCYGEGRYAGTPRRAFELLWDSINGQRPGCSWASDPFVWCLSFRVLPREGGSARV